MEVLIIGLISIILWVIVAPFVTVFLGVKIFKIRTWIIISVETLIVLILTLIGIIENDPTGNMQRQLTSYFGNIKNYFYLKYIPFIIITLIFIKLIGRQNKRVYLSDK